MKKTLLAIALAAAWIATPPTSAQTAGEPLHNEDIVKLVKAGMSESFILDLLKTKPATFRMESSNLIELKNAGVNEKMIIAMARKSPPKELWNSDTVIRMAKAGFSEDFLTRAVKLYPGKFATDTGRIVELKEAGVPEGVIAAMVGRSGGNKLPVGTSITIRMIDSLDSRNNKPGDRFRASLEEPIVLANEVIANKGADCVVQMIEEKESSRMTGKTILSVALVSIKIRGREVALNTDPVGMESKSRTKKTVVRSLVLAGAGAAIGGAAGGGSGAAIGAAAGGGAGAMSTVLTKGEQIKIPSETVLRFRTAAPVGV
jgi:hypothetical protein